MQKRRWRSLTVTPALISILTASSTSPLCGSLEIVGEAASRVPAEERSRNSEIPWTEIIGLRNRLIHAYDFVDHDILWQIITIDLPPLVAVLEKTLGT